MSSCFQNCRYVFQYVQHVWEKKKGELGDQTDQVRWSPSLFVSQPLVLCFPVWYLIMMLVLVLLAGMNMNLGPWDVVIFFSQCKGRADSFYHFSFTHTELSEFHYFKFCRQYQLLESVVWQNLLFLDRYSLTKAVCIAFVLTFFSAFDVPVFWPILLFYWLVLFVSTMKRQIMHMVKYKYVPFTFGKQVKLKFSFNYIGVFSHHPGWIISVLFP